VAGCGAATGGELAGLDHLQTLRAAARQPALAECGATAGGELAGADHNFTLRAAARQLDLSGIWAALPTLTRTPSS
jgi:hypothetical protein